MGGLLTPWSDAWARDLIPSGRGSGNVETEGLSAFLHSLCVV